MYYISKDTFDSLDPETQKKAIADTKELVMGGDKSMDKKEPFSDPMSDKDKAKAAEYEGREEQEEKENSVKSWEDANKKSMALIIGVGKGKPMGKSDKMPDKMKGKMEPGEEEI